MRLVVRILTGGLTLLSLLACITLTTLWIRSYRGTDYARRPLQSYGDSFSSTIEGECISIVRGQVRYTLERHTGYHRGLVDVANLPSPPRKWYTARMGVGHIGWEAPERTFWERRGFAQWESGWSSSFADSSDRNWGAPLWPAVVLTALLPAMWLARRVRRWRLYGAGRCGQCGYDLRATPERCPECGAVSAVPVG